jgi:hypothetical protein
MTNEKYLIGYIGTKENGFSILISKSTTDEDKVAKNSYLAYGYGKYEGKVDFSSRLIDIYESITDNFYEFNKYCISDLKLTTLEEPFKVNINTNFKFD